MLVLNGHWKEEIKSAFNKGGAIIQLFNHLNPRGDFLETIWEMSQTAFDTPREIQVVIDSNNELFIDFGTASFVDFSNEESLIGMKLPIKCWIHTHPFGKAYFSGTDMTTINTWKTLMLSAIVLGDNEHQTWMQSKPDEATHYIYSRANKINLESEYSNWFLGGSKEAILK